MQQDEVKDIRKPVKAASLFPNFFIFPPLVTYWASFCACVDKQRAGIHLARCFTPAVITFAKIFPLCEFFAEKDRVENWLIFVRLLTSIHFCFLLLPVRLLSFLFFSEILSGYFSFYFVLVKFSFVGVFYFLLFISSRNGFPVFISFQ